MVYYSHTSKILFIIIIFLLARIFLRYLLTRIKCMVVVHSNDDNDVLPFHDGAARLAKTCLLILIGSDIKRTFRLDVLLNQCLLCFSVGHTVTLRIEKYVPSKKNKKYIYLCIFRFHDIFHTFKNYFTIIFSIINF